MSDEFDDYAVGRLNAEECEISAANLRRLLKVEPGAALPPIMEVLTLARSAISKAKSMELLPREDEFMGRAQAFAKDGDIVARKSIVEGALTDNPLARSVLVHELVHVVFHPGPRKFRIATGNITPTYISDEISAERQACRIGGALLMPVEMVMAASNSHELASTARVPREDARERFASMRPPKRVSQLINPISDLTTANAAVSELGKKFLLWNKLPLVPNEPPERYRLCGPYQIEYADFGKTTQCGWFIECNEIKSFFATRYN